MAYEKAFEEVAGDRGLGHRVQITARLVGLGEGDRDG
jgi:hypothetical protein